MINLYINNASTLNNLDINILEKLEILQKRNISSFCDVVIYIANNTTQDSKQMDRRRKQSDFILNNKFNLVKDCHRINIIYSYNKNNYIDTLLTEVKKQLKTINIIPSIIDIELKEEESNCDISSLSFEYNISSEYNMWLYNDTCLNTLSKFQFSIINENSQHLLSKKRLELGNTQASVFTNDPKENLLIMEKLVRKNIKDTGIPMSLALAQFVLESGFGRSELAKNANNLFGMKTLVPYNKWYGTVWNENMIYKHKTTEEYNGKNIEITRNFRKYNSIEESIVDYLTYLLNTSNGMRLRYEGIDSCKDYKKACKIVSDNHYATNGKYESFLLNIINYYKLMELDEE